MIYSFKQITWLCLGNFEDSFAFANTNCKSSCFVVKCITNETIFDTV